MEVSLNFLPSYMAIGTLTLDGGVRRSLVQVAFLLEMG